MAASTLDPALAKKSFNNWIKGALAVLFAREGLTEFVQNEITEFQRDLLNSIFTQHEILSGTTCNSCTTANLFKCPTPEFCGRKRPCKSHDPSVQTKTPNQKCPKNICNNVKDTILNHHRFRKPSWQITNATKWFSDAFEIAKCYLPPKGYCNKKSLVDIDFNGTMAIIINNKIFQNKLNAQLNASTNIFAKGRDMINANIRHSASYELSDIQLAQCIDALREILQDSKFLLHDRSAKDAVDKLNQLQSNILTINAGDITKVLEENFRESITKQQQDALQAVLKYFESAQTASVAALESIKSEAQEQIRTTADGKKQEILQMSQQRLAQNDDTRLHDLQEDLITYYRENESFIPAAPLVEEHKVPLEDLYVRPPLRVYENPFFFGPERDTQKLHQTSDNDAQQGEKITVSGLFLGRENSRYRKIFVTADAGFGKTSLSQKLTLTWCQAHDPLEALEDKHEDADLDVMKYFDILFLLHLRDYQSDPRCNLDDLIMHMVTENLSRNAIYTKEFVQGLLHEKKCLIIVDGLDEWAHPEKCKKTPAIPHNNHPNSCTVLTTTRSWKLGTIGLSPHHIDRHVKISILDENTRHELERKAIQILNDKGLNLVQKDISAFHQAVNTVYVKEVILLIPYILLQLICLFFGGLPIGKSKCEVYRNIIELTLERGLIKKDLPDIHPEASDDAALPNCMKKNTTCNRYINLIMKLGKLAFFTLFGESEDSSLIFDREKVSQFMTDHEIEFCLKVGLLCQTKDSRIIAVKRYKVYFQHKSVQEYFSAIYITSEWKDETVQLTTLKKCSSLRITLDMSDVFVFVCGESPEVYASISDELQKVVDRDNCTCRYRNDIVYNYDDEGTLKSYQCMQLECFKESVRNENETCSVFLQDVLFRNYDYSDDLKKIIHVNKGKIKSLKLSAEEDYYDWYNPIEEFLGSLDSGVFSSLETLTTICQGENAWLVNLLNEAARSIKCIRLSGYEDLLYGLYPIRLSEDSDFTATAAFTGLARLQSLSVVRVGMPVITIERLCDYIRQTTTLRQLELENIDCYREELVFSQLLGWLSVDDPLDSFEISLDLRSLKELKILYLNNVPIKELRLNPACLKEFKFYPNSITNTSLWEDLRGAEVLSSLLLNNMEYCQEMIQTIPTLIQLKRLTLENLDDRNVDDKEPWRKLFLSLGELPQLEFLNLCNLNMYLNHTRFSFAMAELESAELERKPMTSKALHGHLLCAGVHCIDDTKILFSPTMSKLELIKLKYVKMSSTDWRDLFLSVASGLPQSVTVKLNRCDGPSEKEWKNIEQDIMSIDRLTVIKHLRLFVTDDQYDDIKIDYAVDEHEGKPFYASMTLKFQTAQ